MNNLIPLLLSPNPDDANLAMGILKEQNIDTSQFFLDNHHLLQKSWETFGLGIYRHFQYSVDTIHVAVNDECRKKYSHWFKSYIRDSSNEG